MATKRETVEACTRQLTVPSEATIDVEDGIVVIQRLVVHDCDLAEYLAGKEERGTAVVDALKLGVRILRLAETSGDVEMVRREFDAMAVSVNTGVDRVLCEAQNTLSERLTKFGKDELKGSLDGHRDELKKELTRLFGPESAVSVYKQTEKLLEEQARAYRQGLAQIVEPSDDPDNPFNKLRKELRDKAEEAVKEVKELRDKVVGIIQEAKGVAAEGEKGTLKGRRYQEALFEEVQRIARMFGDTAHYVADVPGCRPGRKGLSKEGDVVVDINPRDADGAELRLALEAKDRGGMSLDELLAELDGAKENRLAQAAVAVFSQGSCLPRGIDVWRDFPQARYACVFAKDHPDPLMLEFTYRVARFDALRSVAAVEAKLDIGAIKRTATTIRARLNELDQVKRKLDGVATNAEQARQIVDTYRNNVRSDLGELDHLLATSEEGAVHATP